MPSEDQALIKELVRSIDKKLEFEAVSGRDSGARITIRTAHGEASVDLPDDELQAALDDDIIARNTLRERIKRGKKRIRDAGKPYMPWKLPKIEPIGAPGPRPGWGGGRR